MAYVAQEARQELLDEIAVAIDQLGAALAALGDAYEGLDEQSGDRLEEALFRPTQAAYGRAKRTYADFAARHLLTSRDFDAMGPGRPSTGVKGFLEAAADDIQTADETLADLQDSLRPIEVGDEALRAGLADVRAHLADLVTRAERAISVFGR
jgi:hypothetical protein